MSREIVIPKYDIESKNEWLGMFIASLSVMVIGLGLLRLLMDNAGEAYGYLMGIGLAPMAAMHLLLIAVFSPIFLGGAVGWAVAYGAGPGNANARLRMLVAAGVTVPIILLDPWPIVALGMGESVVFPIKLVFLSIPILMAVVCAYSGWSDSRSRPAALAKNLLLMVLVLLVVYIIIYRFILPVGNPTAIPLAL